MTCSRATGVAPHARKPDVLNRLIATKRARQDVIDCGKLPVMNASKSKPHIGQPAAIGTRSLRPGFSRDVQALAT
jgi:hypothetical protein